MMTGESVLIPKDDKAPFLLSGSIIVEGTGSLLVLTYGKTSFDPEYFMIHEEQDNTPLKIKLSALDHQISNVGMVAFIATFSVMLLHHLI